MDDVLKFAIETSIMDPDGFHHVNHWVRVMENGIMLAELTTGADVAVVKHFALLHDIARIHEGHDPHHGHRAAELLMDADIDGCAFNGLSVPQMDSLIVAVRDQSDGMIATDPTIGVCWDADRLDLIRVGVDPCPALMSTEAGKRVAEEMTL